MYFCGFVFRIIGGEGLKIFKSDEHLSCLTHFHDIERVFNPLLKIGGVYGTWGESFDNERLPSLLEQRMGKPLAPEQRLSLADLGFTNRHHIAKLSPEDDLAVEVEIGARLLIEACRACGWDPSEVEGVLIGMSAPTGNDYVSQICKAADIPDSAQ